VDEVASDREKGGFFASQDADVGPGDDGDYFTWTVEELEEILEGLDRRIVALHYNIYERGEMHHDPARNVLFRDFSVEEIAQRLGLAEQEVRQRLEDGKKALAQARSRRPSPFVDESLYVNWNGMMAYAYLEASWGLERPDCMEMALKSLERVWREAFTEGKGFSHRVGSNSPGGLLEDQVQMARALLGAFQATADEVWLERAEKAIEVALGEFWDDSTGGFFDIAKSRPTEGGLRYRLKPIQDSQGPSANAVAAQVLLRLHALTGKLLYISRAEAILRSFAPAGQGLGLLGATYFLALDEHLGGLAQAVIVGPRHHDKTRALHQAALRAFRPGKVLMLLEPERASRHPGLSEAARAQADSYRGEPVAYVCAAGACAPPTSDPQQLVSTLSSFGRRAQL
jgi:hypothetical protein